VRFLCSHFNKISRRESILHVPRGLEVASPKFQQEDNGEGETAAGGGQGRAGQGGGRGRGERREGNAERGA